MIRLGFRAGRQGIHLGPQFVARSAGLPHDVLEPVQLGRHLLDLGVLIAPFVLPLALDHVSGHSKPEGGGYGGDDDTDDDRACIVHGCLQDSVTPWSEIDGHLLLVTPTGATPWRSVSIRGRPPPKRAPVYLRCVVVGNAYGLVGLNCS